MSTIEIAIGRHQDGGLTLTTDAKYASRKLRCLGCTFEEDGRATFTLANTDAAGTASTTGGLNTATWRVAPKNVSGAVIPENAPLSAKSNKFQADVRDSGSRVEVTTKVSVRDIYGALVKKPGGKFTVTDGKRLREEINEWLTWAEENGLNPSLDIDPNNGRLRVKIARDL